jgi:hypothetical protein
MGRSMGKSAKVTLMAPVIAKYQPSKNLCTRERCTHFDGRELEYGFEYLELFQPWGHP